MNLLTKENANAKVAKSAKNGNYLSTLMHLAPAQISGREVCASRSVGCTAACLYSAGRGRFTKTQQARINRTRFFFEDRAGFVAKLTKEITSHVRRADKLDKIPCVRLNGTSDIVWEKVVPELFDKFPGVTYYDYTKHVKRCLPGWALPSNYHLTFSRSEENEADCLNILRGGKVNVAAVFYVFSAFGKMSPLPKKYRRFSVFNADADDLRFLDNGGKGGKWAGLIAKGDAKKDVTGFVIR